MADDATNKMSDFDDSQLRQCSRKARNIPYYPGVSQISRNIPDRKPGSGISRIIPCGLFLDIAG
jgi:hypothetical protein